VGERAGGEVVLGEQGAKLGFPSSTLFWRFLKSAINPN